MVCLPPNGEVFGALVQRSSDLGVSWDPHNEKLDYPDRSPHRVRKVWQVQPGTASQPGASSPAPSGPGCLPAMTRA